MLIAMTITLWVRVASGQPAEPVARAEQAMQRGLEAAGRGDYATALTAFEEAASLVPTANVPHKLAGEALEALNRPVEAAAAYERYITIKPDAKGVQEIQARIARLNKERIGTVEVSCAIAVEIKLDDRVIGTTPRSPIAVAAPASYQVELSAAGYLPQRDSVAVTPGERAAIACALVKPDLRVKPPDRQPDVSRPIPAPVARPWYRQWKVIGPAIGVAVAAVGVGLFVALSDSIPETDGGRHNVP